MMNLVTKFFSKLKADDSSDKESERQHDIRIATCALFLEMANIDGEFSEEEKSSILSILKDEYDLSDEYAAELLETANEELKRSIDLWQFSRLINQNYSMEEKIQIIEMLWKVVYTDKILDKHEDYLIHKLANLLRLTHKQLIDAKLKVICSS